MPQELADSSYLLADKALHPSDAVRSIRAYTSRLFADVAVRIVAYACDIVAFAFSMTLVIDHVFNPFIRNDGIRFAILALATTAWFAACWTSPLRATPAQILLGIRVLHKSGRPLSLAEAIGRSVALVAVSAFAVYVLRELLIPGSWLTIAALALLLYVPSVTARRQGLHDFLAQSVVVNKRAIRSTDGERRMREFLGDRATSASPSARPSTYRMILDAATLMIPLLLIMTAVDIGHQRNIYGRIGYAMGETLETRDRARVWFESTGSWPKSEADLGLPLRRDYPAGGYFQLEDNGVIRIQFERVAELRNGSILIEPEIRNGGVKWNCRAVGDIDRRYLPGGCRE